MNSDLLLVGLFLAFLGWLAGMVQIVRSHHLRLVKLILLCIALAFPPFSYLFLLRNMLANDIKNAPQRLKAMSEIAAQVARATGHQAVTTAKWLSKK
jgi:hypothetical protein